MDADLASAFEATWPAAEYARFGGVVIGRGAGGGGRVSSAHPVTPDWATSDLFAAVEQAQAWKQPPRFRVLGDDKRLIDAMKAMGFQRNDPTFIMDICADALADTPIPRMTTFEVWPPLAVQSDIWVAGSIGAGRQAVMKRAGEPRCSILGRIDDRAAGTAFVAAKGDIAMLHALEVLAEHRRKGLAGWMVRFAAEWALKNDASRLALAVMQDNQAAVGLYRALGFREIGEYAYWQPA